MASSKKPAKKARAATKGTGKATRTPVTSRPRRAGRATAAAKPAGRPQTKARAAGTRKPATARPKTKARALGTRKAATSGRRTEARPQAKPGSRARRRTSAPGAPLQDFAGPLGVPGLNEEDQIRAAKFLPRELPKRLFEEERFLFPESYGLDRVRLLVRDPEWIFAYWDVSPAAMRELAKSIGERALALSRLTLRMVDPTSGAVSDILLPPGARWWYVRTDASRRRYRAELGVTLPTGEFRRLAESNVVVTPRVGASSERARRRLTYEQARGLPLAAATEAAEADSQSGVARTPWAAGSLSGAREPAAATGAVAEKGGASDAFGLGSSELRPGASDGFRR